MTHGATGFVGPIDEFCAASQLSNIDAWRDVYPEKNGAANVLEAQRK